MDSAFTQNISEHEPGRYEPDHRELDTQPAVLTGSRVVSITRERHGRANGRTSRGPSTLVQRNIAVGSHRTTVRLEPAMWDALGEICQREDVSLNDLCSRIADRRSASSLTATIRVFVMSYFRAAATEEGHARTGHGLLCGEDGPRFQRYRKPEAIETC